MLLKCITFLLKNCRYQNSKYSIYRYEFPISAFHRYKVAGMWEWYSKLINQPRDFIRVDIVVKFS